MGFVDRHLTEIAERIMEHIDLEEVTREVMSNLVMRELDLYFVVSNPPDMEGYEFVGLAYSQQAASLLWAENNNAYPCKIFKLDMGKAMTLGEQAGIVEEVS